MTVRALILFLILAVGAVSVGAQTRTTWPATLLLNGATTTATSFVYKPSGTVNTFQAFGATTAGAGAATIVIEVSNIEDPANGTNVDWITAGTITLTLATTRTSDGFGMVIPWRNVRARITAISGTGAAVSVSMGRGQ